MPIECQQLRVTRVGSAPVAFVTTSMGIGGAERLLVDLITRMDRRLFAPILVCLKEKSVLGEELAARGIPVFDRFSRRRFDVSVIKRLASFLCQHGIQVLCTVGTGGDRSFWGRLAAWWARVPVVVSCPHSMGLPDRFEPSNRLLSGITDAFIAVAHRQKQYLVQSEGFASSKIRVIHNGIDLRRFFPQEPDVSLRASHGIPEQAPLAGLIACLRPEKDVEMFLQAAAIVRRMTPAAHFVVVGDGPERRKLEATARELDLADCVHFVGMCADVRPWLGAMEALVLTSIREAFPVSLLEAMACGKPVVATRVGAIPEMVSHGKNGLLVAPGNPEQAADALCRLFNQRALARQMGRDARAHVEQHFNIEAMVRGYEALFAELLHRKYRPIASDLD